MFDGQTGSMKTITNKLAGLSGVTDKLSANFLEYSSSTGDDVSKQPSGDIGNFTATIHMNPKF